MAVVLAPKSGNEIMPDGNERAGLLIAEESSPLKAREMEASGDIDSVGTASCDGSGPVFYNVEDDLPVEKDVVVGNSGCDDESREKANAVESNIIKVNGKNNGMVDGSSGDDTCSSSHKVRATMKFLKNVNPEKPASNVRCLLSTGLFEGIPVTYRYDKYKVELPGVIKDLGYACGCSSCNYTKVLSALEFEKHAQATSKNQNNHIFLHNGKTLCVVIRELKDVPLNALGSVVENVIGCKPNFTIYEAWRESFSTTGSKLNSGFPSAATSHRHSLDTENSSMLRDDPHGLIQKENNLPVRPALVYCQQGKGEAHMQSTLARGGPQASGKRRASNLHSFIFTENDLPNGTSLIYRHKRQVIILEGYKMGNGIICSCCNTEVSPSTFESHAGFAARRQPYHNIYTSDGLTLHDLSISLSKDQNLKTCFYETQCAICGDEGKLLSCTECQKAFHGECLDDSPDADMEYRKSPVEFHCPYCSDNLASKDAPSTTGARPIIVRVKRVVFKVPASSIGGCVICRSRHYSQGVFNLQTLMLCNQCEKEYHVGCLRDSGLCDLKELPRGDWFCCEECSTIHAALRNLIFKAPSTLMDANLGEVNYQLLSGKNQSPECKMLLSKAAAIFRDGFAPIMSYQTDMVPAMVFGRSGGGQDFYGMYCAVLTVRSVVVCAGILRIFGSEFAELPLVATMEQNRGKGYFRYLFSCIEKSLALLKVQTLILPADEDVTSMWIDKFGFKMMPVDQLKMFIKDFPIMIFHGTSMLEKSVPIAP